MGKIQEYFLENSSLVIDKWIHYLGIYERHFDPWVGKSPVVLEIGVFRGGSLEMWKSYFGEGATVVGIDIDERCLQFADPDRGIHVEIGDQSDAAFLDSVLERYGRPDIVIDDGSHMMHHLIASFEHLYPRMKPYGVYLAEDLHTCYWDSFGGGLRKEGSFMELVKGKLDELNAQHTSGLLSEEFAIQTRCVCAYDSIVVFEKKPQGARGRFRTGSDEQMRSAPF